MNEVKSDLNLHSKEKESITEDLKSQIDQLQIRINQLSESREKDVKSAKTKVEELEVKLKKVSNALSLKKNECENLKNSFKKLKLNNNASCESLFDVCKIKAELSKEEEKNKNLLVLDAFSL